ncbi:MAG: type III pantothenate kinase [Pseudoxanthomonas sp.]
MSRWLFDLGNSRLKCAPLHDDGSLGEVVALAHERTVFAQQLQQLLPERADSACLASVASPALTASVIEVLTRRFRRISMARSSARLSGLRIAYAEPARLGVDRFLALLAARGRGPGPWLIAGVGTALTIDLLDREGLHRGGRIGPSPMIMRQALHQAAAQLPPEGGDYREFASDTADALASGCEGAALGLIDRSLVQATRTLGEAPALLLHGGGADMLAPHFPDALRAPALVLEGLALWSRVGTAPGITEC